MFPFNSKPPRDMSERVDVPRAQRPRKENASPKKMRPTRHATMRGERGAVACAAAETLLWFRHREGQPPLSTHVAVMSAKLSRKLKDVGQKI